MHTRPSLQLTVAFSKLTANHAVTGCSDVRLAAENKDKIIFWR